MKSIYLTLASLLISVPSFAVDTCGGVSSDVFDDVYLYVTEINDGEFEEEGLSFQEYPTFSIEKIAEGIDADSAGTVLSKDINCVNDKFELVGERAVVKDIVYQDGVVSGFSLYHLEEDGGTVIASFDANGVNIVSVDGVEFTWSKSTNVLSKYLNTPDAYLGVYSNHFDPYDYDVSVGSLQFNTSEVGASSFDGEVLVLKSIEHNLVIEVRLGATNKDGKTIFEAEGGEVWAGALDRTTPLELVGTFTN